MDFLALVFQKLQTFFSDPETLKLYVGNRFIMILLVIVLLKIKYATYSNLYLSALINIPGTLLHELSHFFIGLITNAYPTRFDLLPKKHGDYYIMGSVGFRNITFYNAIPSALAPLLLLFIGYYFNRWFFTNIPLSYMNYTFYVLLQTIIIENAVPSSTDFKVAFSYPLGLALYGAIAVLAIIYAF